MTVLRGDGLAGGADEPYGPIVRAIGPALRALPDDDLADRLGSGASEVVRLLPDLGRPARAERRPGPATGASPPRNAGRPGRWRASSGVLGRLGEHSPVLLVIEDLHRADAATRALVTFLARISRDQRLAIVGTFQPDVVGRDDPWLADLAAITSSPRPPDPARPPAARSRRAGRADRGHPGRARLGQPAAPRRRTVGRPAARRGGAPGGPPGAAEQLADRLVRRARHRPDGDPLGRMPARRPADRAGRAAPGSRCSWRPWPPPSSSARTGRRRARSAARARATASSTRTCWPVSRRPSRTASWSRPTEGIAVPPRGDRPGDRPRPPADRADALPRGAGDEPRRTAVGHRQPLARGTRAGRRPRGRHRRRRLRRRPARRRRRAGRARARPVAVGHARRRPAAAITAGPRRRTWSTSQVRASEAAFAVGPDGAGHELPRGGHRRARRPQAIASSWACSTTASVSSGARPATRPGRCWRPAAPSSSCPGTCRRNGRRSSPRSPS